MGQLEFGGLPDILLIIWFILNATLALMVYFVYRTITAERKDNLKVHEILAKATTALKADMEGLGNQIAAISDNRSNGHKETQALETGLGIQSEGKTEPAPINVQETQSETFEDVTEPHYKTSKAIKVKRKKVKQNGRNRSSTTGAQ